MKTGIKLLNCSFANGRLLCMWIEFAFDDFGINSPSSCTEHSIHSENYDVRVVAARRYPTNVALWPMLLLNACQVLTIAYDKHSSSNPTNLRVLLLKEVSKSGERNSLKLISIQLSLKWSLWFKMNNLRTELQARSMKDLGLLANITIWCLE